MQRTNERDFVNVQIDLRSNERDFVNVQIDLRSNERDFVNVQIDLELWTANLRLTTSKGSRADSVLEMSNAQQSEPQRAD